MASHIRSYVYLIFLCASASAQVCQIPNGCTGASTSAGARTNLGAAGSPVNSDLTSINILQAETLNALTSSVAGPSVSFGTSPPGSIGAVTYYGGCSGVDASTTGPNFTAVFFPLVQIITTGSGNSITWVCPAITGAASYRIYESTSVTGSPCRYFASSSATYVQTGLISSGTTCSDTANAMPTSNTTGALHNGQAVGYFNAIQNGSTATAGFNVTVSSSSNAQLGLQVNGQNVDTTNPATGSAYLNDYGTGTQGGFLFGVGVSSGEASFLNNTNSTCSYFDNNDNLWLNGTYTNTTTACSGGNEAPNISGTAPANTQIACWKSATQLGHCTTLPAGTPPTCTCT